MINKEYVLKNHSDELLNMVHEYGLCSYCENIGCKDFCQRTPLINSCKETFEKWLSMEHVEELFPIGTVVEFNVCCSSFGKTSSTKRLGYYNGCAGDNQHCVCIYKENIGKSNVGLILNAEDIKKVGD